MCQLSLHFKTVSAKRSSRRSAVQWIWFTAEFRPLYGGLFDLDQLAPCNRATKHDRRRPMPETPFFVIEDWLSPSTAGTLTGGQRLRLIALG